MARPPIATPSVSAILALVDSQGRLAVRATPNARAAAIALPAAGQQPILSVRTTATPADGEANDAVLDLLAKALHCPRSALTILRGQTSRNKIVQIAPPSVEKTKLSTCT